MEHLSAASRIALYVGDWPSADQATLERALAALETRATEPRDGGPPWLCVRIRAAGADLCAASRLGRARQYRAASVAKLIGRISGATGVLPDSPPLLPLGSE